ncbi:MAG: EscU/YscU/HrcU family type III secretion system export apparatus switch protein, partial [Oscillospiraceae bacterium]
EKKLKMSKQEIKEEYKQMEGDPQIKGKIKEKQRAMAMNRMMQNVPSADVVIKNPTHFAVAIKYDPEKYNAPMVLAKGQDRVALKIIEIAEENGIITMENRPLARALYAGVEIGKEVPAEFYQSVAEVLAYVYNLNKKEL